MAHWYIEREWTPWQQKLWHSYWYGPGDHPMCVMLREAHKDYWEIMGRLQDRIAKLGRETSLTQAVAKRISRQHEMIVWHINTHVGGPAVAAGMGYKNLGA